MKAPRLDAQAVGDFLVRHGEKIVVAIVGLASLMLVWGGIHALQSLSVTDALTPDAVNQAATQARGHIDRDAAPPADLLPVREPLANLIDPWRTPLVPWNAGAKPPLTVAAPPVATLLDKPLFDEFAKRGKPDVLPIEDLRAVAGIAVAPVAQQQPDGPKATSGVMPYVIVTGLIPVKKQRDEYQRRFKDCGFRDARRDSPLWCDYEIERGTVGPDGKEAWTRIDLAAVAKQRFIEPGGAAAATVSPEFLLSDTEELLNRQTTPLPFCGPLPPRLDGGWELADVHPWITERQAKKLAGAAQQPEATTPQDQPTAGPGFGGAEEPTQPQPPAAPQAETAAAEYRLFRFVDLAVAPGATYRYRVRVKLWNPNWSINPKEMWPHLEDPALAREPQLASPESAPSTAATVPDTTRILVAPLRPDEMKDLRIRPGTGTLEILVLGPSAQTGSFALRALVADPGAVIDVDEKYNLRNQRDRARGERIVTRRLLVDAHGRQEERRDGAGGKGKQPDGIPEPLEVICLRPDGSFEVASVDGSEQAIQSNRASLPPRSSRAEAKGAAPTDELRGDAFADPLAIPGAGK